MVIAAEAVPIGYEVPARLRMIAFVAMTLFYACAISNSSTHKRQSTAIGTNSDRHIYVTSEGLAGTCYQGLGQLDLKESYSESVIESADSRAQRLRDLALQKYSKDVDAVIDVRTQDNDAGTVADTTGEAVHLQQHQTVQCVLRNMPAMMDSAAAVGAGGIVGTVLGGLAGTGGSVYGAEAGGAMGASAAAGIESIKRERQQQADEAEITDRIERQEQKIAGLRQELARLLKQQCDAEELSEQDCDERVGQAQKSILQTSGHTTAPSGLGSPTGQAASAPAAEATQFAVRNRIEEQQETIDRLERDIGQIRREYDQRQ